MWRDSPLRKGCGGGVGGFSRLLCPCDFPSKYNGVVCHFLPQGIFPTQGLKPRLLHWQADSLPLSHQGSPLRFFAVKKTWLQVPSTSHPSLKLFPETSAWSLYFPTFPPKLLSPIYPLWPHPSDTGDLSVKPSRAPSPKVFVMPVCMCAQSFHLCQALWDPTDCWQPGSSVGSSTKNTGLGSHALLQGIFLTQGSISSLSSALQV